jgi:HSP20 family protein
MSRADWDPLKELAVVRERMNRMFETAIARTNFDAEGGFDAWTPLADVHESAERLTLQLELPGVDQNDIELHIEADELLVRGERRLDRERDGEQFHRVERSYGKFARRFALPSTVDRGAVAAQYRNGVLTITLPKKDGANRGPIRVSIT